MKLLRVTAVRRARIPLVVAAVLVGGLVVPQSSATTEADLLGARGVIHSSVPDEPIAVLAILDATGTGATDTETVTGKGTQLFRISREGGYGLPDAARRAYERASRRIERTRPGCGLPWGLLAGIGRVESDHGRYGGSKLGTNGVSKPPIIGIALDGVGPVAAIPDTDNGRLDGDKVWDRAVGPMQFIPSTWATAKVDGDNDGVADPHNLFDASLAAAGYLCPAGGGSIGGEAGMRTALFSYNRSDYYVDLVYAFAVGYHTGVFDIPSPPVEEVVEDVVAARPTDVPADEPVTAAPTPQEPKGPREPRGPRDPQGPSTPSPQPTPDPTPTPDPPAPTKPPKPPKPTPTPEPEPEPTLVLTSGSGAWSACGSSWCLSGRALDLGSSAQAGARAAADFDGDGTVETNKAEFDGLVGSTVTIQVEQGTAVVYLINGMGFRNADGSFSS